MSRLGYIPEESEESACINAVMASEALYRALRDHVDKSVDRGHPNGCPPREVLEMELGIRPEKGDT